MAIISDLVAQIDNPAQRERISAEVDKLAKQLLQSALRYR